MTLAGELMLTRPASTYQPLVPRVLSTSRTKPVAVHLPKKRICDRVTGLRTNNRIDPTARTNSCTIAFFEPIDDLRRRECTQTVETAALLACVQLRPMVGGVFVRLNIIRVIFSDRVSFGNFPSFHCLFHRGRS